MPPSDESIIVVGAGQAGLATGYFLQKSGLDFTIVADDERIGDPWRDRWESMRLFTPASYNSLPGMAFPGDDPEYFPGKDEVADYLERYAEEFDLPVELNTRVTGVRRENEEFILTTDTSNVSADYVVVATGANHHPNIPPVAADLPNDIFSCHSSEYTNPSSLQAGDVLVVGAGNSGTQIATEIANDDVNRRVWLVGPDRGQLPRRLLGRDFFRWAVPTIFRFKRTGFLGRKLYQRTGPQGDPVFADAYEKMQDAGVDRVTGRITDVENGRPTTEDGHRFDVFNVIWATGFRPEFTWIELDMFTEEGYPKQTRGVTEIPGLYFVGLPWLYRASSSLIGGVGADAEYIANHISERIND